MSDSSQFNIVVKKIVKVLMHKTNHTAMQLALKNISIFLKMLLIYLKHKIGIINNIF